MGSARLPAALMATALVLTFPNVAPATPSSSDTGMAPPEYLEMIASSLEDLGAPEEIVAAARTVEEGERGYPYVVPVNDLDHDGLSDVVTVTTIPDEADVSTSDVVVTARRGVDGSILWTFPTGTTGVSAVVPATVGEGAGQGLLLVSYRASLLTGAVGNTNTAEGFYGFFGSGVNVSVEVLAVSGDGQELWRYQSPVGHFVYPPVSSITEPMLAENVPVVVGTFDGAGSPATDVLLALYDRTPTLQGQDDRVRTIVLDGADGSEASMGTTDITGARTVVRPGPDLDGDGLDDYTILIGAVTGEAESGIRAMRGIDGGGLWFSPQGVGWTTHTLQPIGDATGDGPEDLVLRLSGSLPDPDSPSLGTRSVTMLDGATGTVVWEESADTARAIGDVTGDGRADVLLVSVVRGPQDMGLRYRARTMDGVAWTTQYFLPTRDLSNATLSFTDLGDVDRDTDEEGNTLATPDFRHHLRFFDSSGDLLVEDARIVGGRTGETLRVGDLGGTPLQASVDGQGDDLVAIGSWGETARDVTAVDGLGGEPLWATRLYARGRTRISGFGARAADLDGDGRAELVVNGASYTTTLTVPQGIERNERYVDAWVLSGVDGSLLWWSDPLVVPEPADVDGRAEPGTPFEWDGTQGSGTALTWGTRAECSSDDPQYRCDRLLLELSNPPAAGEQTATADAAVEIRDFDPVPAPLTDLDLSVYESDAYGTRGPLIDASESLDPVERVEFPFTTTAGQPSRFILVEVEYYTAVESAYRGVATVATGAMN